MMSRTMLAVWAVAAVLMITGCARQAKTENSQQAIQQSQQLSTPEEKVDFLVSEAKAFLDEKKYDEGIQTANYILANLDQQSKEAQEIIQTARAEIEKTAREQLEQTKKDVNKAIDGIELPK